MVGRQAQAVVKPGAQAEHRTGHKAVALPATGLLLPLRLRSLGLLALWFGACAAALSLGLLVGVAGTLLLLRWPVGFLLSGALLLAVPGLAHFLLLDHAEVKNWYERQHPEAFAPRR
jgi:hypothetical protein